MTGPKSFFWHYLASRQVSDSELMRFELRDFARGQQQLAEGLSLEGSGVGPLIQKVKSEIRRRGLSFEPHFWVSDEWFCADGIPGVAVPFYLLHPRLLRMERQYVGKAEGATEVSCLRLLRHECGHAVDNAFRLRKHHLREPVFGCSSARYPKSYSPRLRSRDYVTHIGDGYAQSHPDEDFAETFAVWLGQKAQWRSRYQGWGALNKLEAMDKMMTEVRGLEPRLKNQRQSDPLRNVTVTLGDYYRMRRKQLGIRLNSSGEVMHHRPVSQQGRPTFYL